MKVFKYWAREGAEATAPDGQPYWLSRVAGSNDSQDDANSAARDGLSALRRKLAEGWRPECGNEYEYGEHGEIREELIRSIENTDGQQIAALTRNRYGAIVLNAPNVMFADVDHEPLRGLGLFGAIGRLFGRGPDMAERLAERRDETLARVKAFSDTWPELGLRVYETHSGLRVVVTSAVFDPQSDTSKSILNGLASDTLFQRLCERQNCYRARITIKPWRADLPRPPKVFPIADAKQRRAYDAWLKAYDSANAQYAVCRKLGDFGRGGMLAEVAEVLTLHDRHAVGRGSFPLA